MKSGLEVWPEFTGSYNPFQFCQRALGPQLHEQRPFKFDARNMS